MALMPISAVIRLHAERDPDRPSITYEGQTVTRLDLEENSNRLARAYEEVGVREGDFVTVALANGVEFYEACLAIWKLGATPQPVSSKLPFRERDEIIKLANPSLIVGVEPGSHSSESGELFPAVAEGFEASPDLSADPISPDRTAKHYKAMTSGGSTGRPKLIVSAAPGEADPEPEENPMEFGSDKAYLVPGPLYHNAPFAFSMGSLMRGNHIVVMKRFEATECLRLIEEHKIDHTVVVPTMMHRIWRLPTEVRERYDVSSLRALVHMAAPCPPFLKEAWIEWLGPKRIFELYGGTEAQGATWLNGQEWLDHRGSVGKPLPGSTMKIFGPEGQELPPGEMGEVFMMPDEGQGTTYHYRGAEAKSIDGWESLGDMGYMDEEGYLYLGDRQTDMILCGGANIYPAEVEAAIDEHPNVRSSAVIGLPDDDLGAVVHGIVDAPEGVTEEDLLEHLGERLARYKVPRSFEFSKEPLRDDAGKVRRSALRAERLTK